MRVLSLSNQVFVLIHFLWLVEGKINLVKFFGGSLGNYGKIRDTRYNLLKLFMMFLANNLNVKKPKIGQKIWI